MFGYISADPARLREEDFRRYRGCYCGLCRALKAQCGGACRLALSYDMTFLILLLTAAAHMPVTEANGVSKAINLATNISALVVFLINGKVIFAVGLVAGLFSIAGNWLGSSFFKKGGSKAVKPIMICVLVIFFVKVLGEVIG